MERTPLMSAALVSAGYNADTQQLEIEFKGGRIYRYYDVPSGVYEFLLRTPSKGGFVNRMIDGKYRYEEISTPVEEVELLAALTASLRAHNDQRED
jgi:hypothetical protein